jgi:hypothetical protein
VCAARFFAWGRRAQSWPWPGSRSEPAEAGKGRERGGDQGRPDGNANRSYAHAARRDGSRSADGDAPRANDADPDEIDDDHGSTAEPTAPTAAVVPTTSAPTPATAATSATSAHRDDDGHPDDRDAAGRSHHNERRAPTARANHD